DEYVDCGNNAAFDITDAITLSAWIKTADSGNGENNPFVSKGNSAYAIKHYSGNNLQFFIYDGNWFNANAAVDSSFNGDWRHVAGTYDGSELRLYVDGGLRDTNTHAGTIEVHTDNLAIGWNSEETGRFYNGAIDEVKIFNRALSEGEILFLAD
ncbi:MAG: LamG domain-containing protein, partial [Sedimentisphaerales bacterium]|nr:LamG domain-containing protein [Sedimentisphaerales bacterium]